MMRPLRSISRAARNRRTIHCGGCRFGPLMMPGSTRKSPTSITRPRAPLPAPSPARYSCSASSRARKHGCMSTSMAGPRRRSRHAPREANARRRAPSLGCLENAMLDPRLTPARPDLAARHLQGKVKAGRFVEGEEFEISDAIAPMREGPSADAMLLTQALKGEHVTIYDRNSEGFAWG